MMKRMVACVAALAMLGAGMQIGNVSALTGKPCGNSSGEPAVQLGDVNADGKVDIVDTSDILSYYAESAIGIEAEAEIEEKMAAFGDINKDSSVDLRDASLVLGFYAQSAAGDDLTLEDYVIAKEGTGSEPEAQPVMDENEKLFADYAAHVKVFEGDPVSAESVCLIKDLGIVGDGWRAVVLSPFQTVTCDIKKIPIYVEGAGAFDSEGNPYEWNMPFQRTESELDSNRIQYCEIWLGSGMYDLLLYKDGVFKEVQTALNEGVIALKDVDTIRKALGQGTPEPSTGDIFADYAVYASARLPYMVAPEDVYLVQDLGMVGDGWRAVVLCPSKEYTEDCKEIEIFIGKEDLDCDCYPYRVIFLGSGMFDLLLYKDGVFLEVQQAYDEKIITLDELDTIVDTLSRPLIYG